jgi:TBC1 domain family protein 5
MAVRRTERWFQQLVGGGDVCRRRREYAALREKRNTDPREAGAGDVSANNPLMHTEGSSWAAYFATQEVRKTIALDLERLHPGDEFYSSPDIQAALLDILTVWSLENPSVGYRQGMHELASLVLSQRASDVAGLGHEWGTRSSPPRDPVVDGAPELSASYVEHDAYAMFSAMLGPTRAARAAAPEETTPIRVVAFFEDAPGKGGFDQSEVKGACDRVFAALGAVDPPLKQHLERLGIEPQLFLLRWFRVLFSREFHLDDAMRAWSAFFAANKRDVRDVIEAFAAAMVLFLRAELMAADDFGTCLRRLQKFPPVEDIDALIERAREIAPAVANPAARVDPPASPTLREGRARIDASLSPEMLGVFGGPGPRVTGPGGTRGAPGPESDDHKTSARDIFAKAKDAGAAGRERAGELFAKAAGATKSFVGSLSSGVSGVSGLSSSHSSLREEEKPLPSASASRGGHGAAVSMVEGARRKEGAADAGPGRRPGPAREAGGIGIGWIERNAASADAGERLRDVSLEDGPSDAHRPAQADALRRAVVEVTRVLESGAARGAVEASLRGVVVTLENAADALRRDART